MRREGRCQYFREVRKKKREERARREGEGGLARREDWTEKAVE